MRISPLVCAVAVLWSLPIDLQARTWTSVDGKSMEAEYLESDGKTVTVKRADGKAFTLPLDRLSGADREFVAEKLKDGKGENAPAKESGPKPTGEIRDPGEGGFVDREFAVKGRTRDAPKGYVAMLFRSNSKDEFTFPHAEFSDANRSFTTYVRHLEGEGGEWALHLHVLPESDAEKLAAWSRKAGRMVIAGEGDKIEAYDDALVKDAIHIVTSKYFLKTR